MTEQQPSEALEKLSRGIQESRQMVQQQTMKLAQDYFGDSVKDLEQQIQESRSTLEGLPDQVPGGRDESFQMLFQELMDNYTRIEECLNEAQKNVAELDTQRLIKQGEVEASDAARREARERGIDLTEVEGTGSEGRITIDDVKSFGEKTGDGAGGAVDQAVTEGVKASDAAKRKAEELGVDLSQIQGSGSGGNITVNDVTNLADDAKDKATALVGQTTNQAKGVAGQVTGGDGGDGPRATNAARRKAEELGVDLSKLQGTGAGGIITIQDVMKA